MKALDKLNQEAAQHGVQAVFNEFSGGGLYFTSDLPASEIDKQILAWLEPTAEELELAFIRPRDGWWMSLEKAMREHRDRHMALVDHYYERIKENA